MMLRGCYAEIIASSVLMPILLLWHMYARVLLLEQTARLADCQAGTASCSSTDVRPFCCLRLSNAARHSKVDQYR
jgi:hypothetical protein